MYRRTKGPGDARELALLHELDEALVGGDGGPASGQAQDEGAVSSWFEGVDPAQLKPSQSSVHDRGTRRAS